MHTRAHKFQLPRTSLYSRCTEGKLQPVLHARQPNQEGIFFDGCQKKLHSKTHEHLAYVAGVKSNSFFTIQSPVIMGKK